MATYLVPVVVRDIHTITPLQHSTVVDEDIKVVHHLQSPLDHLFGILPDGQIARDDIGLTAELDDRIAGVGVVHVTLSKNNPSSSLSQGDGDGRADT